VLRTIRYLLWGGARLLLALRYHWTVRGRETLRDIGAPVLLLPNHPAYIDPMLVYVVFYRQLLMRPMVFAGNFNNPLFRLVKTLVTAYETRGLRTRRLVGPTRVKSRCWRVASSPAPVCSSPT